MNNEEKNEKESDKNMNIIERRGDEEFHDFIANEIFGGRADYINEKIDKGNDVVMTYDTFTAVNGVYHRGFDTIFKLDGLLGIINRYFISSKIDLKAEKYIFNRITFIKIVKFERMKIEEGEGVSKTERKTERDNIEIIEESKDKSKEKVKKKIEESRKLINQG